VRFGYRGLGAGSRGSVNDTSAHLATKKSPHLGGVGVGRGIYFDVWGFIDYLC
jgi:hypothetical protein